MKKTYIFFLVVLVLLFGCRGDDNISPEQPDIPKVFSLTFLDPDGKSAYYQSGDGMIPKNHVFRFKLGCSKGDFPLKKISFVKDGKQFLPDLLIQPSQQNYCEIVTDELKGPLKYGEKHTYTFTLEDTQGNMRQLVCTLHTPTIQEYGTKIPFVLGQGNTLPSFFSFSKMEAAFHYNGQSTDLVYFFNSTDHIKSDFCSSPSHKDLGKFINIANWKVFRKTAMVKTLDGSFYDNATEDLISSKIDKICTWHPGDWAWFTPDNYVGHCIAFETQEKVRGIMKIISYHDFEKDNDPSTKGTAFSFKVKLIQ